MCNPNQDGVFCVGGCPAPQVKTISSSETQPFNGSFTVQVQTDESAQANTPTTEDIKAAEDLLDAGMKSIRELCEHNERSEKLLLGNRVIVFSFEGSDREEAADTVTHIVKSYPLDCGLEILRNVADLDGKEAIVLYVAFIPTSGMHSFLLTKAWDIVLSLIPEILYVWGADAQVCAEHVDYDSVVLDYATKDLLAIPRFTIYDGEDDSDGQGEAK